SGNDSISSTTAIASSRKRTRTGSSSTFLLSILSASRCSRLWISWASKFRAVCKFVSQCLSGLTSKEQRHNAVLHDIPLYLSRAFNEPLDGQRGDVQSMGFAVENLFRDQLADGRGMLESVPAETVCKDETIETGDPAENGMRIRRSLITSGPGILDGSIGERWKPVNGHFHHLVKEFP